MQSNERFDTYLTSDGYWLMINTETGNTLYSNKIRDIASSINMQLDTLVSLVEGVTEGSWPALLGGEIFKISSIIISPEVRIVTLSPIDSDEITDILSEITGDELFVLISSSRKILAMSKPAVSLFNKGKDIASLFDSSSAGAIEGAVRKCLSEGSTPEFLVSHGFNSNIKCNYSLSLRKLPSPGRLIFCRLSIPSVAIVAGTVDRKSLIGVLLEESFCPTFIIDSEGLILSMNEIARGVSQQMWGIDPTGSNFIEFVHPKHKEALQLRHEERNRGYATTSRFSVRMMPAISGSEFIIDISVVPIPDTDQFVIFAQTSSSRNSIKENKHNGSIPLELIELLSGEDMSPGDVLERTISYLGADSAAFVREGKVVTVGDSRRLIPALDPIQLAASSGGFQDDGIFIRRIHSGFGISHLVLHGIPENQMKPDTQAVLDAAALVLGKHEAMFDLKNGHRILSTVKVLAEAYFQKKEPLEGLLSDLVKECRAETAIIFKINPNGSALIGIGASGVVGRLPDLPLEGLNTASWACLRGETAFYAESPEDDLRFSPVFLNSRSELAVPFFNGSTTDGVILLATTENEAFHYVETEMIQMMAILFTVPESTDENSLEGNSRSDSSALKKEILDNLIHNITALDSVSDIWTETMKKADANAELKQNIGYLAEVVTKLGFFSRWALWWLKISVYNGVPDHRWIDPSPLLGKVLREFGRISAPKGITILFQPPENDIEVCTDGAFISMIAHSLLVCILENCDGCKSVNLSIAQKEDHWTFRFDASGGSVPPDCLSIDRQLERKNMAFALAWKLTEELGGTINTFSNKGKTSRMIVRLRVSG